MTTGRTWGYARVSTAEQDTLIQREALLGAGVPLNLIFEEKASGTNRDARAVLNKLLDILELGDTLVVTRIDRLARSMRDFLNIMHDLKTRGVKFRCTEQAIDTGGASGQLLLNMLAVIAEFETQLRAERQKEGIAKAKAAGVYKGRPQSFEPEEIRALVAEGKGPAAIARELGCSRQTVYRALGAA